MLKQKKKRHYFLAFLITFFLFLTIPAKQINASLSLDEKMLGLLETYESIVLEHYPESSSYSVQKDDLGYYLSVAIPLRKDGFYSKWEATLYVYKGSPEETSDKAISQHLNTLDYLEKWVKEGITYYTTYEENSEEIYLRQVNTVCSPYFILFDFSSKSNDLVDELTTSLFPQAVKESGICTEGNQNIPSPPSLTPPELPVDETEIAEEWDISIHPEQIQMTADGATYQIFVVTILLNGEPVPGEKVGYYLRDMNNQVDDDKEGFISLENNGVTDKNGQVTITYNTQAQPLDFQKTTLMLQATHKHGNPQAFIELQPAENLLCGNWFCNMGENVDNCPQDCPREVSKEDALAEIEKRYHQIELNPLFPPNSLGLHLGVFLKAGSANNFLKSMSDLEAWYYEYLAKSKLDSLKNLEKETEIVTESNNLEIQKTAEAELEHAEVMKKLSAMFDEYVCSSYQINILEMLDSLRFSENATERKMMEYYDYAPISWFYLESEEDYFEWIAKGLLGHEAVLLYPTGSEWRKTGVVLDPWLENKHSIYKVSEWTILGLRGEPNCQEGNDYPICGREYTLTTKINEDEAYFQSLPLHIQYKIEKYLGKVPGKGQPIYKLKKHYLLERLKKSSQWNKITIIVDCPVYAAITNLKTGEKVGFGPQASSSNQNEIYHEIRAKGENSFFTYLTFPQEDSYQLELFGTDQGSATIYKAYPQETGEKFEIYEYKNIPLEKDKTITTEISIKQKNRSIVTEEKEIKGIKTIIPLSDIPSNSNFPSQKFTPTFDLLSFLIIVLAFVVLAFGFYLAKNERKKNKKYQAKIKILISLSIFLSLVLIVVTRYFQSEQRPSSNYPQVTNTTSLFFWENIFVNLSLGTAFFGFLITFYYLFKRKFKKGLILLILSLISSFLMLTLASFL